VPGKKLPPEDTPGGGEGRWGGGTCGRGAAKGSRAQKLSGREKGGGPNAAEQGGKGPQSENWVEDVQLREVAKKKTQLRLGGGPLERQRTWKRKKGYPQFKQKSGCHTTGPLPPGAKSGWRRDCTNEKTQTNGFGGAYERQGKRGRGEKSPHLFQAGRGL